MRSGSRSGRAARCSIAPWRRPAWPAIPASGHAEHLVDDPAKLNTFHPGLTELGKSQVLQLRERLTLRSTDIVLVSPTRRTIETAMH
nr:histidine phosphatase family protein [Paenibacillus sp. UNC496MF]